MNKNYYGVQSLRGLGALLVVVFHVVVMARDQLDPAAWMFTAGAAGVDLFFVISGFIMVVATRDSWGKQGTAAPFLLRRLIRIVPLYWLFTTLKLLMILATPVAQRHTPLESWHTIASYLFIPAWNSDRHAWPLVIPGWTLSFEMFFYLLFAGALLLRLHPTRFLSLVFAGLAAVGFFFGPFERAVFVLLDARLLEFVLGMWIAHLTLARRLIPVPLAWVLVPVSIAALLLTNTLPGSVLDTYPLLIWGVPSAMLLYAVVSLENHSRFWQMPIPRHIGDASYAIYLSHELVISMARILVQKAGLVGTPSVAAALALSLIGACVAGVIIHHRIERPIIRWLRTRIVAT